MAPAFQLAFLLLPLQANVGFRGWRVCNINRAIKRRWHVYITPHIQPLLFHFSFSHGRVESGKVETAETRPRRVYNALLALLRHSATSPTNCRWFSKFLSRFTICFFRFMLTSSIRNIEFIIWRACISLMR